jgi:uncharacterized membrane protein HdeD (DUF308 family)
MTASEAESRLSTQWAWVVYRGVVAVLFGLIAFARPAAASLMLVLLFGAYAFGGGVAAVITALRRDRDGTRRDVLLLDGVVGIGVAFISFLWPGRMTITAVWVVGAWALATGAMEVADALRLRPALSHEWSLGFAGLASIAFGLVLLFRPLAGGVAVMWSLGAYALAFGVLTIALGVRLRSFFIHAHGRGRQMPRLYLAR